MELTGGGGRGQRGSPWGGAEAGAGEVGEAPGGGGGAGEDEPVVLDEVDGEGGLDAHASQHAPAAPRIPESAFPLPASPSCNDGAQVDLTRAYTFPSFMFLIRAW